MSEKLKYGISVINENPGAETFHELYSNSFHHIEISGLQLENEKLFKYISSSRLSVVNIRHFMDRSICAGIADQPAKIKNEFIACCTSKINKIRNNPHFNFCGISADFVLENAFDSPLFEQNKIEIIKRLAVTGLSANINFFVPVRVPSPKLLHDNYNSFIRKTMSPNVSIMLDVHPHEFPKMEEIADKLKPFKFTAGLINITYEAFAGNLLSEKLIGFLFRILRDNLYEGIVLFCPTINNNEAFCKEIARLNKCLSSVL